MADRFCNLGIATGADSSRFPEEFDRPMYGPFKAKHLDSDWHRGLDGQVLHFRNEVSTVCKTVLLLGGLVMPLQFNLSVGEGHHAEETIKLYKVYLIVSQCK
jgi:hypothetical protein